MLLTAPRFTYDGLMPTDVVMPQMGESIAEGTIVRWIKKVGDSVERDEPLFEISTDKVDAEIPSPVAGVIAEIRAQEGETVPVNSVVAVIGAAGTKPAAPAPAAAPPVPTPKPQADGATTTQAEPAARSSQPAPAAPPAAPPPATPSPVAVKTGGDETMERSSPLVRRIAKEHNVDISQIRGTGIGGRVTKDDILGFIGGTSSSGQAAAAPGRRTPRAASCAGPLDDHRSGASIARNVSADDADAQEDRRAHDPEPADVRARALGVRSELQPRGADSGREEGRVRASRRQAHLSVVHHQGGGRRPFVPCRSSTPRSTAIRSSYHKDVNIGIAVALDWGLIVPVVRNADSKNLLDLSRTVADLAARARSKQLKPEEVSGGTFTITNPGVFGALFGMPIINQPQVAILGIGNVEKRPVVIDDAIAIRPMAYLSTRLRPPHHRRRRG